MKKLIGCLSLLLFASCFVFAGDETVNSYRHFAVKNGSLVLTEVDPNSEEHADFPDTIAPSSPDTQAQEDSDLQRALSTVNAPVVEEEPAPAQEEEMGSDLQRALQKGAKEAIKEEKETFSVNLNTLIKETLFEFNSSKILEYNHENLDVVADFLKENKNISVKVEGHTDNNGSAEYNQKLSEKRAESVKQYLVDKGVEASRITTEGFGFSKPVADNDTDEGQAQNRRTELIFKMNK